MMNDMIGRTIGRYQIVEHLGRGGMAEVFKAYQASLDRYVALKLMHSFLAEDAEFFARFEREAKNIAALHHPNIIQIHDFDREGSASYMVMEFVDGGTLKDRLNALAAKGEILPLSEAIRIIKDVGAALAFAHGSGMIHRDIKPANVLIDRKGRVILTDFGIAKMVSSAKFTASGSLLGTPAYMAPEQGLGQPGDHRADIYSLGVMLYQLVTGVLPYEADTPVAVILKHVNEPLPMPRTIKPDLPVGLERIIAKAMAKEAGQRYQHVDDMLSDLNDLDKAALIPIPEATMVVNARTATGQIPVVGKGSGTPPPNATTADSTVALSGMSSATPVKEERRASPVVPIIIGVVVIGLLALVGAALLGGPQLLAMIQGPTATPIVITVLPGQTLPPDLSPEVLAAITQQAATAIAQQATIVALQATDTPPPTQDLTATALACPLGVTVDQQTPPEGSAMTVGRDNKISIQLKNSGECAWTEGTTFAFVEGDDPRAANATDVQIPATDTGATTTIELTFKPATAKTYASTWQVKLPDGRTVGEPIKLTYIANPPATARPTTIVATVPPRQSPTPVPEGGGLDAVSLRFRSCDYADAFYECNVTVNITGGVAPWNVTINGANNGDLTFEQGSARSWLMSAQRCQAVTLEIIVIDGNNDQISNVQTFDPNTAAIFPGGSVCSP